MTIWDEMPGFYEDIDLGCQAWSNGHEPQFIDFDSARVYPDDYCIHMHVGRWMNLAEYAALGGHRLFLENGLAALDSVQPEEDHGEVHEGMHPSGCDSIQQARLTEEQAEGLRRKGWLAAPETARDGGRARSPVSARPLTLDA
jgi:hypothetical protein